MKGSQVVFRRWVESFLFMFLFALIDSASAQDRPGIVWMGGGHDFYVSSVAFSPDGSTLASGSVDRTIKLWRVSDGVLLRMFSVRTGGCISKRNGDVEREPPLQCGRSTAALVACSFPNAFG